METFSALTGLCAGIQRSPVNSPHKGQWRATLMFSLICAWINAWVNNRETGDLRRHRAHYDVIVMFSSSKAEGFACRGDHAHAKLREAEDRLCLYNRPGIDLIWIQKLCVMESFRVIAAKTEFGHLEYFLNNLSRVFLLMTVQLSSATENCTVIG